MSHTSSADKKFLAKLQRWFRSRREVLLMIRHPYSAGSKDFELHGSYKALKTRLRGLKPSTWVVIFRQPQLPVRGVVDGAFVKKCQECVVDGAEYLISERVPRTFGRSTWYQWCTGRSHAKMREDLDKLHGCEVAMGAFPPWVKETNEVIHAVVPEEDGVVRPGIY
jgi:hypothetical protein